MFFPAIALSIIFIFGVWFVACACDPKQGLSSDASISAGIIGFILMVFTLSFFAFYLVKIIFPSLE